MAYTKTEWVNDSVPAINASNLNKIEQGIYDNSFESGSNANGSYIKYADGTLICTKHVSGTTTCNTSWGSLYETPIIDLGSFAMNFIAVPYVLITNNMNMGAFNEGVKEVTTSSYGKTWIARAGSVDAIDYGIDCIAIGRWK